MKLDEKIRYLALVVLSLVVAVPGTACSGERPPVASAARVASTTAKPVSALAPPTESDPFRWMESLDEKATSEWLHREADEARRVLDGLPERSWFARTIAALNSDRPKILRVVPTLAGDFVLSHEPQRKSRTVRLRGAHGKMTVVLEGTADKTILHIYPSPDGKYLAYQESQAGEEHGILRIFDVARRKVLDEFADRVTHPPLEWLPGKPAFSLLRIAPPPPGGKLDVHRHAGVTIHTVGTSFDKDATVLGGTARDKELAPDEEQPSVTISPSGRWAVGAVQPGGVGRISILVKDARNLSIADVPWQRVMTKEDRVMAWALQGDDIYVLSQKDAPNGRVLRFTLSDRGLGSPEVILPETSRVLEDLAAGTSGLYVSGKEDGLNRLMFIDYVRDRAPRITSIPLPEDASVREIVPGIGAKAPVAVRVEGWFRRPEWLRFVGKASEVIRPSGPAGPEYRGSLRRIGIHSKDGTEIPVTILGPAAPATGAVPTVLFAYGSYGIPVDPEFRADLQAWVQRGGMYVVAHVRGGGEKGEMWHRAGQKENKHKAIEDYLAVAEHVIASGIANRDTLIAFAGSAGGITVGSAVVERPELFAGAIFRSAILNPVRLETTGIGPGNVAEFGSEGTPEGLRALRAMDPYEHVRAGVKYPDMLFLIGANDSRVPAWQSGKFVERVRQANGGNTRMLMRVAFDDGHGNALSTPERADARYADAYAFAWERATRGSESSNK